MNSLESHISSSIQIISSTFMTTSSKDFVIDLIYNNQSYSDVILEVGANKFYLHLPVIKQHASALFEEFEKISNASLISTSQDVQLDQMLINLTTMITKPKKTLKITDLTVTKETLDVVLKSMYTSPPEVTTTNYLEVYKISTRFGMKELSEKCIDLIRKSLKVETLLEDYKNAFLVFSPLTQIYLTMLKSHLSAFSKDKLLEFIPTLMYETILEIVTDNELNCTEDLVYEIVDAWYQHNKNLDEAKILTSKIKLELLSSDILVTKVKENPLIDSEIYLKILESRECRRKMESSERKMKYVFALGKIYGKYQSYRLVVQSDFTDKFRIQFKEQYDKHSGIYCLDSFSADLVCCLGHRLGTSSHWLRVDNKIAIKDNFAKFCTSETTTDVTYQSIHQIQVHDKISFGGATDARGVAVIDNTGLFVRETTIWT
jgi:hypothetical protein